MEENTATMQTLVIAHAAFGQSFFKNNIVQADGCRRHPRLSRIRQGHVAQCEERHGRQAVERRSMPRMP
jgi:spore cortex formation protein SpoVR/YcgB (stage V sporulation)